MTIVSGFLTNNAVVLAADSQEVVSDFTKASTQKIQITNYVGHWRLAMAGSSDHSQYIRLIESELSMRLANLPKFDYPAIVSIIKATVHQVHKQHIWPRPSNRPEVQIIYAIQGLTPTPSRALLVSEDSAVTPVNDYMSVGIGTYLADYLKKRIYPNRGDVYNAPIEQVVNTAIFVLQQVKKTILGCGEETNVVVFYGDGTWRWITTPEVRQIELWLDEFHNAQRPLLRAFSDSRTPTDKMEEQVREFSARLALIKSAQVSVNNYVDAQKAAAQKAHATTPSGSQKSEKAR